MLYPSVGVLSFRLEMSECSIDWVVESQLKFSQSYFMLFQPRFSKKNQIIYPELVIETDSVDQYCAKIYVIPAKTLKRHSLNILVVNLRMASY